MKRAGGWTLGIVAVLGMLGGAFLVLRPILFRAPVKIVFVESRYIPKANSDAIRDGFLFALSERSNRSERFRLEAVVDQDFGWVPIQASNGTTFIQSRKEDPAALAMVGIDDPPVDSTRSGLPILWCSGDRVEPDELKPRYCFFPSLEAQGRTAAHWARRLGATRTFILSEKFSTSSAAVADAFLMEARSTGVTIQGEANVFEPYPSLWAEILEPHPDLIFLSGVESHGKEWRIFAELREKGYRGTLMIADAKVGDSQLTVTGQLVEGTYLVTPLIPPPSGFRGPAGPYAYSGYLAGRLLLDALDRPQVENRWTLREALDLFSEFGPNGGSTRSCAGYIVKNGAFEPVELPK